jgi:hypothetical protein
VGRLYLAYDLLGGQHGPLRLLTRIVTYSIVFGVGYGIGLGPFFGLASGVAIGLTTAIELNRVARGLDHCFLPWEGLSSAIRGFGFGVGLYRIVVLGFATAFAVLITLGQVFGYSQGISPSMDYVASRRPRRMRRPFWGTVVRTFGYFVTALVWSALVHHVHWFFAIRVGLATGIVTGMGQTINPYIEILCRQPSRALARGLRHWTHPLRLRSAIPSVLAGSIRRAPGVGNDWLSSFRQGGRVADQLEVEVQNTESVRGKGLRALPGLNRPAIAILPVEAA